MRRFGRTALRILTAPLNAFSRMTSDGAVFVLLTIVCGLLSIGQNLWSNIPLLMCLVLVAMLFLALWQGTRALRAIHYRRSHVERVFANEPFTVTIHLQNSSRLPCAGIVVSDRLETERPARAEAPASESARTAANALTAVKYGMTVRRRGVYRFGQTQLETVFPLGLFNTLSQRTAPGRLVVYPRMGDVDSSFFEELELALQHMRMYRPSRAEEDFRGLREYRHGDNPKWIHWRSTARTQRVLIKEFEEPQARRVLLMLDTNLQRLGTQRLATFEMVISFAATLARDLARRGYELDCVALQPGNKHERVVISRERRNLDSLLEMLAGLRRDDTRSLDSLRDIVGRRALHHVYVLVVGLGSLRAKAGLNWLHNRENVVRIFDARGDEFRRAFKPPGSGTARDQFDEEDMLLEMGEEEEPVVEEAGV
jgi:uncharacterized protein (DUF58 family)